MTLFADRAEAGRRLAARLLEKHYPRPVVFALPRGGLPVAAEIARALDAPLDIALVRKIGHPLQPELAIGAIVDGETPELVINRDLEYVLDRFPEEIERIKRKALEELARRRVLYLKGRARPEVAGATAIVVDDGLATGATARAALRALRRKKPARLVLAVPVAPPDTVKALAAEADEIVCLEMPSEFYAVGQFYGDFRQLEDADVERYLTRS